MKTTMYKTYQNSTNPDWQPHIAWREIIHVIIDPVLQQQNNSNEQNDLSQLAAYGDININFASIGSIPILHTTGDEYLRCINARKNIVLKAKRKLPRTLSDANKNRPITRRMSSLDQQQIKDVISNLTDVGTNNIGSNSDNSGLGTSGSLTKRSRNFFKNVNRLHWGGKHERHNSTGTTLTQQKQFDKHPSSQTATTGLDESSMPADTISLVSHYIFFLKFMIHDQDRINLC